MKHVRAFKFTMIFSLAAALLFASSCVGTPAPKRESGKAYSYKVIENGEKVVFVFNEKAQNVSSVTSVNVAGTFNKWDKASEAWKLEKKTKGVWELTVSADKACIPGNSGYAEFKYVIDGGTWVNPMPKTPAGYTFFGNNLIVFPGEDIAQIIANEKIANRLKGLKDFDLDNPEDIKTIANFRLVPGTDKLFRSYNPCRESKPNDSEVGRLTRVNELLEGNEVKSIISLSGAYGILPKYVVSDYVKAIVDAGHFLSLEPSYDSVYYESDLAEFGNQIKEIVEFIIDPTNEAPFLVHCKIGTDRTGVVSAIIAALCGASWENIHIDYQKVNEVGMQEYRDVKLLQYSFENMLKQKINYEVDLKTEISNYFITGGYLTEAQIGKLNLKLN